MADHLDLSGALSPTQEFRRGWRLVLGAGLGVGLGISGLLTYNMGLFADGLGRDIGLSRTEYGAAFFGSTLALAAGMPLVGRMVDRLGPRLAAAIGAIGLSAGFVALSQVRSVAAYVAVMVLVALCAGGSSPVAHTRAVAGAFRRARGLALGMTQVGIGFSAALVPPLIAGRVAQSGWRDGLLLLALLALAGLIPVLLGLPGRGEAIKEQGRASADAFAAIRFSPLFFLQLAAFAGMALAFAGMLSHFVPMLREGGLSLREAGAVAGMIGVAVIVTRIVVGWLADRIEPAWLGAASCAVCAAGCLALATGDVSAAWWGALGLGAAMGAEADLIGILTARNFAIAAYSRAYAAQYAAFMVAGGISPLWIGLLADSAGSYRLPLFVCTGALAVPIILFCLIPVLKVRQPALVKNP